MNVPPPRRVPDVWNTSLDPPDREERVRVPVPKRRSGKPANAPGLVPEDVERGEVARHLLHSISDRFYESARA